MRTNPLKFKSLYAGIGTLTRTIKRRNLARKGTDAESTAMMLALAAFISLADALVMMSNRD